MPFTNRPHLTVRMINALKPPAEGKRLEIGDGRVPGLYVRVTPRGIKSFSFLYRAKGGAQRRQTLGRWPELPGEQKSALEDFRSRAQALRATVSAGGDPVAEERERRLRAPGERTFAWLIDDYIENEARPAIKTWAQAQGDQRLRQHLKTKLV